MGSASVVEPIRFQERGSNADHGSDEDATLVYDVAARAPGDLPLSAATAFEPPLRARASARRLSELQIAVVVFAALIGAMAAAWTLAQQARGAAPPAQAFVTGLSKLRHADGVARVAAATPQPSTPRRPAREASPALTFSPAPDLPSTADMSEGASAAPAARAVPSEPQPSQAGSAAAQRRTNHRSTARARSSLRVHSRPAAARTELAHRVRAPTARPDAPRVGLLRINSRPWSQVYVDGRLIGSTPQTAIELAPGQHRVALINEEFELRRTLTVEVRAGETVTRSVELMQ